VELCEVVRGCSRTRLLCKYVCVVHLAWSERCVAARRWIRMYPIIELAGLITRSGHTGCGDGVEAEAQREGFSLYCLGIYFEKK
jgi:hypothetical protein